MAGVPNVATSGDIGSDSSAVRRDTHWQIVGLVGLLLLTILLRFTLLTTIPVGLHYDEAWSGIDAATVTWTNRPVFFTDSNGMEPLYLYLQTLSIVFFGHTAFALRVVSAVVGTLTVPALYLLVRRIGGWQLAMFAAGLLAVTYWHVHVSRLGYRAISLPLFECLAWWALWNGCHQRDWRWLTAGGALVGVSLYTYSTARAFPLAVMLWFLYLAVRHRDWRVIVRLVLVGATAMLVFAPLGWYFLQHPDEFLARVAQVVVLSPGVSHSSQPAILVGIERTLGMFSIKGDTEWKYNLSGKPIFDPLISLFFYVGIAGCLAVAVRRFRSAALPASRSPSPAVRVPVVQLVNDLVGPDAGALLLLWFLVMIVPGFVTTDPPETLHTLATVPVVCTFPALGAVWLWRILKRRLSWIPRVGGQLAVALVLAEAVATAVSYFIIWAPNPQAYYWLHGDVADLAGALQRAPASATLYVATQYYRHPTLRFLAPQVAARAIWFEADKSLPVRPAAGEAWYAFGNGYQPLAAAASALAQTNLLAAPHDSAGGTQYELYRLAAQARLPALATPIGVTLDDAVTLLDASITGPVPTQPRVIQVSLRWRVLRQPHQKLSLFVHLLDASGHRWAQSDGQGYFSEDWRAGDEVLTTEQVQLPLGTPPVPLRVSADFYDVATGKPLPWSAADGITGGPDDGVILGQATAMPSVVRSTDSVPGAIAPRTIAPGLRILGAVLPKAKVSAGASTSITLYVQKTSQTGTTNEVQIRGAGLTDSEPIPSAQLLAQLPVGDVIALRYIVGVSARTTAGTIEVGVTTDAGSFTLGQLAITPLPRVFSAPTPQHVLSVRFGQVAELIGYDITSDTAAGRLTATLYWQALQPSDLSYTVFAHLVGPDNIILAQHDGLPANGLWPTTAWLPNQIITDPQQIPVVPGTSLAQGVLEVGLYAGQMTGQPRLPASGPPGETGDTYTVLAVP